MGAVTAVCMLTDLPLLPNERIGACLLAKQTESADPPRQAWTPITPILYGTWDSQTGAQFSKTRHNTLSHLNRSNETFLTMEDRHSKAVPLHAWDIAALFQSAAEKQITLHFPQKGRTETASVKPAYIKDSFLWQCEQMPAVQNVRQSLEKAYVNINFIDSVLCHAAHSADDPVTRRLINDACADSIFQILSSFHVQNIRYAPRMISHRRNSLFHFLQTIKSAGSAEIYIIEAALLALHRTWRPSVFISEENPALDPSVVEWYAAVARCAQDCCENKNPSD